MSCHVEPKAKHLVCEGEILRFAQNDVHHFLSNRARGWLLIWLGLLYADMPATNIFCSSNKQYKQRNLRPAI